ncbi:MFS transporter [Candidatus Haliotispira prima]|uniref:MFS transporter n=1 Tax=Candidatus Haliotispira prima TaxID=3034016 RepID=A0ABY8MG46_9SPIO|nr:MFS transporter [Candidatus Haliotispira prima]
MFFQKFVASYRRLHPTERRTVFYDTLRQGVEGGGESLASIIFLYIAIEVFQLPGEQKALLVASRAIGFCLAPFLPMLFSYSRLRRSSLAACCNIFSGIFLLLAGISVYPLNYTIYCSLFIIFLCIKVPLFSQIYRENYQSSRRGKLFSLGGTLRNVSSLLLNLLAGLVIDMGPENYHQVFIIYAGFILLSGIITFFIPSQRFCDSYLNGRQNYLTAPSGPNSGRKRLQFWRQVGQNFTLVLRDRLFLYICFAWYLLGFGNLALIPMRVEFLRNQGENGLVFGALSLVLILQVIPGIVRIIGTLGGGKLFDHIPLLHFRILTNILFILATILFFQFDNWAVLVAGVAVLGLAETGGQFIWNLWITHLAPKKEYVERYMGVHVFLNGTRGLLGPFVSYALLDSNWSLHFGGIQIEGIRGLSWLSIALMSLSTLLFASMAGNPRINRRA